MAEEENYKDESIDKIEESPIKMDVNNIKERKLHTRICPYCKQEHKTKVGVDNWKNLFRKPTMEDWITLVILILLLAAAFAYTTETKACKETLQNLDEVCMKRQNQANYTWNGVPVVPVINYTVENETSNEPIVNETNIPYIDSNLTDVNLSTNTNASNVSR